MTQKAQYPHQQPFNLPQDRIKRTGKMKSTISANLLKVQAEKSRKSAATNKVAKIMETHSV